jgi:hypothetical protein
MIPHYRLDMRSVNDERNTIGFDSIPPDSVIDAAIESWGLSIAAGGFVDVAWKVHDGQGILRYGWRLGDLVWVEGQDSPRILEVGQ